MLEQFHIGSSQCCNSGNEDKLMENNRIWRKKAAQAAVAVETKTLNPSPCRLTTEEPQTSLKPFKDPDNTTKLSNQSETPQLALTQHLIAWERTAAALSAAPTLPATSTPRHSYPSQAFHTTLPDEIQFIVMFLIWQSRSQPNVHDSLCHCRRKPCHNEQSHHWCISTY